MSITNSTPYTPKNDYKLFQIGLSKAQQNVFNVGFDSTSSMFKFACWVRSVDGPSEANWFQSSIKVAAASAAVFGITTIY